MPFASFSSVLMAEAIVAAGPKFAVGAATMPIQETSDIDTAVVKTWPRTGRRIGHSSRRTSQVDHQTGGALPTAADLWIASVRYQRYERGILNAILLGSSS